MTIDLADSTCRVFRLLSINLDEPSIMDESRVGFGYSFNNGNRTAILIVVQFLCLIASTIGRES